MQDAGEQFGAGQGCDGGQDGAGVPAGDGHGGAGPGRKVFDERPARQGLGVGDLFGQEACGFQGQAGGQFDAFIARQLASKSRKDQADGFLGPFPGGVGAVVTDLLQHLVERHLGQVLERCGPVGHHCGGCLSAVEVVCRCPAGCADTRCVGAQVGWGRPKSKS